MVLAVFGILDETGGVMTRTMEVEVDAAGAVHPLKPASSLPQGRALLVWQEPADRDSLLLSEKALSEDWLRPEEDAAWAHLQPDK
jgi:hypothetical protein